MSPPFIKGSVDQLRFNTYTYCSVSSHSKISRHHPEEVCITIVLAKGKVTGLVVFRITAVKQRVSTWMGEYCTPPHHSHYSEVLCDKGGGHNSSHIYIVSTSKI